MKKLIGFLAAILAVFTLAVAGCARDDRDETSGEIANGHTIVYAFTADCDEGSMLDYMNGLKSAGEITFEESDGFITSVLGVTSKTISSTASSYSGWNWMIYTTVTTVDGVIYSGTESFSYNGITFYKAAYGVSGIPCVSGESYALVYEFSSMTW